MIYKSCMVMLRSVPLLGMILTLCKQLVPSFLEFLPAIQENSCERISQTSYAIVILIQLH